MARGSRSRLRAFWDFAYVHPRSSFASPTNQSGTMCGRPRGPSVAHCMTIFSPRKARTSSSDISIVAGGYARVTASRSCSRVQHRAARLLGLEHDGVARPP